MPRLFLLALAVAILAVPSLGLGAEKRPNFLFLFSDDQSYEAVGYTGLTQVETPHLDRLAEQAISLTHAYNQGSWSGAVCVASRTMLNTGRFVWHAERVYQSSEQERQAGRFWSEYFRQAGYHTYMTGKWHVRANAQKAFDTTGHVRGGMPKDTPESYNRPLRDDDNQWQPWDTELGGFWEGGKHWSEVVADDAVDFLMQAGRRDEPFFMYVAFNAPHDPRQSPKEFVDRYPRDAIDVPEDFLPEYPEKDQIGLSASLRDEKLAPFPRTELAVKAHRQEYFAIITHMDQQIGRILKALGESGKADNTYVVFTSDHGLACGHHGLMGKQNMYDHSVRVPLLIAGPGIEPGKVDVPVYLQDIMPTTLELAGIEKPAHVQFRSLVPLLRGDRQPPYDAIYCAYLDLQRMITADGFKLILYPRAKKAKLFDLKRDPQERINLIDDPAYAQQRHQLFQALLRWQEETGDSLQLDPVLAGL